MANTSIFASIAGKLFPAPDSVNHEGAPAYQLEPKAALAQLAATGCFNRTFYAEAQDQVSEILALTQEIEPDFIAKIAIYAREQGFMKDMPALLCAVLTLENPVLAAKVFNRVISNGRMLRTFVQIMRSGVIGRKSLGSAPKRLVKNWLLEASDRQLVDAMVGKSPSLADIIKMVHPKAKDDKRNALFAYIIGKPCDLALLPSSLQDFIAFKADQSDKVPAVPFQMLTALDLGKDEWSEIARNAQWHMLRMNLNTFNRHGVFEDRKMVIDVAKRLQDTDVIRKVKAFPYQLMAAYIASKDMKKDKISSALEAALEVATENIPSFDGNVAVAIDVSGSMQMSVTGWRKGATSKVACVDVAALIGASVLRKNPKAEVLPFDWSVHKSKLKAKDSIMKNANWLRSLVGGGTDCSAPLRKLNKQRKAPDLVIMVSDNESWIDNKRSHDTGVMREWSKIKARNPKAKLVCVDIAPYTTSQALERDDILNVGGFSDTVFKVISAFNKGQLSSDHWVGEIDKVEL